MQIHVMFQVDTFTDRVFAGNPAAVLVLDRPLDAELMQAVAAENNLAETAFAWREGDGWAIRWFTPTHEAAFCGHATLATAHVLMTAYATGGPVRFATRKVGDLTVARVGQDRYAMTLPRLDPVATEAPAGFDRLFPDGWSALVRNFENYFVELSDPGAVRAFAPDLRLIAGLGEMGLCVTAAGGTAHDGTGVDFLSRYFWPGGGIDEDPVTGSTHATLVPYWADRLGKTALAAFQASRRGGLIGCDLGATGVTLTGSAATYMRAMIYLP